MKIVHLNTHCSGGSSVYARTLSDALCHAGHGSIVLHRDPADRPLSDKVLRKVSQSMVVGAWHGTHRTLSAPSPQTLQDADVLHLHTVADWFDVPSWIRSLPRSIQLVVSLHDLWHVSGGCFVYSGCERFKTNCRPCPLLREPARRFLATRELRRKAAIYREAGARFVANSCWLRDLVKDSLVLRDQDAAVIPPPVDPAVFHAQERTACRAKFDLHDDDLVVATGCASLTDTNKDTQSLLYMLAELKQPRLKVLLFGEGEIHHPANLDVRWLRMVEDKTELAAIYGAADLFASASHMETYGLTLAEAYACGCSVVAYNTGGIPEALPCDPSVSLVPLGDRTAFIGGLRQQLNQLDRPKPLTAPRRKNPKSLTPQQSVKLLLDIYN